MTAIADKMMIFADNIHLDHVSKLASRKSSPIVFTWDMFFGKSNGDDVISWFGGTIRDPTRPVFYVLGLNVHFTGTLNGQSQATVTWTKIPKQE